MSTDGTQDRIKALLANADAAIKSDELQKASQILVEASHLDSDNAQIKERWAALQKIDSGNDVVELLRIYLGSQTKEDGQKALTALRTKKVPSKDALQATEALLAISRPLTYLDSLTGVLLSRSVEARKKAAARFANNATGTFEQLFERGEESFAALATIPLDNAVWSSKSQQVTAQQDLFRLCVATLMKAGAEHLERVMRALARLLSLAPDTVAPLSDEDVLDAILSCLDLRLSNPLRSQAILATSKLLEATKERGEELFSSFITERAARQTNNDLIIAFSAAASVFPIIPAVAARLFLIDGFVQQLVPNLERNWEDGAAGNRKSHMLETAALELLSAACVDKPCREAIERYCSHWLKNLSEEREGTHKALAALVLAKISADSGKEVTVKLEQMVLANDPESDQAVEGLAYTSLQPKIKEEIASNNSLVKQLVKSLTTRPAASFGCLTIFANITNYRPSKSEEQQKMSQLKAFANSEKPAADDPLEDEIHVTKRCRTVLHADIIPALVASCKQTTSPTNIGLIVRILLALAREQKHRATMAQQGAVKVLLQIKDRLSKTDKSTDETSTVERDTAHALARILISINPSHVFSSTLPASSAVSALAPLLSQDQAAATRNLLPVFEALLGLTNLASLADLSILDLQLRLIWAELEDHLLFSPNTLVQRASVELVCNLMASPACVAKFVGDGSKREGARMQIILALADVEDMATRRAAGGALAMLTEWDAAVEKVLEQKSPDGVKTVLRMCADGNEEIRHRGFACLANIVNAPGEVGKKGVQMVKEKDGVEIVKEALKGTKSRDVMTIGVEVLKKIM